VMVTLIAPAAWHPGCYGRGPRTVATRIPPGNESPIQGWTRLSATLAEIAYGTGDCARQSHHRDRSAGTARHPFPTGHRTAGRRSRVTAGQWDSKGEV
jgi:hypothetical protein